MNFRVSGLAPDPFHHLYGLTDAQLRDHGVVRVIADRPLAFPDRIELRDGQPGEALLLVNYLHQPASNPYRASHAIFVLEGALRSYNCIGEIPLVLRARQLSLRSFDAADMMLDAELVHGSAAEQSIGRLLADCRATYIQAHYATRGCYAARIERA
ncbi:MAG TPA: DUF1203 domain-containing protein [Steroidobacteraceae bacterium]|jgi:hypothetical protein|nr:DUF1203 domain-containing protein [Steroidobacteraceae bacterium]